MNEHIFFLQLRFVSECYLHTRNNTSVSLSVKFQLRLTCDYSASKVDLPLRSHLRIILATYLLRAYPTCSHQRD